MHIKTKQDNKIFKVNYKTKTLKDCVFDVIDKIKEIVEGEAADLERYQEEMRRYRKLMKLIHSESPLFRLPEEDLAAFYRDGDFKPPKHRYNGRKPKIAVIFDDCLGSAVYSAQTERPRDLFAPRGATQGRGRNRDESVLFGTKFPDCTRGHCPRRGRSRRARATNRGVYPP